MNDREFTNLLQQWGAQERGRVNLSHAELEAFIVRLKTNASTKTTIRTDKQIRSTEGFAGLWSSYIIPHIPRVPQLSALLSATVIVVAALISSSSPSDTPFYKAKFALEKTRADILSDPAHRTSLELELLENGVSELRVLPFNNNNSKVEQVLTQLGEHAGKVSENLEQIEARDNNDSKTVLKVALEANDKAALTHEALKSIEGDLPHQARAKFAQASQQVAKARLASLRVLTLYSENGDENSHLAGRIVKDGLEKEIKATMENLYLAKAHARALSQGEVSVSESTNPDSFSDAESRLEEAQKAFSEGNFIIALESIILTNDLIYPQPLSDETAVTDDTINTSGEQVQGDNTTTPEYIDEHDSKKDAIEFQDNSGNPDTGTSTESLPEIKNIRRTKANNQAEQEGDNTVKIKESDFPVGFDL